MLQKLSKCEVKSFSVKIQEFNCHLILRELNSGKIQTSKFAFFPILETLNFEFWT